MKCILTLLAAVFIGLSVHGQTNVINIYNSQVTINNTVLPVKDTNIVQRSSITNKVVILRKDIAERLQWENMLEQRRIAAFNSYLRKYKR